MRSVAACVLLLMASVSAARSAGPSLELATTSGVPGDEITMPLYFRGDPERGTSRLSAEIRYPGAALEYRRLEQAAATARLRVDAVSREDEDRPGDAVLQLDIRSATATVPSGVLGYLVFAIRPEAKSREGYAVTLKASAFSGESTKYALAVVDGKVLLGESAAIVACFYYMH